MKRMASLLNHQKRTTTTSTKKEVKRLVVLRDDDLIIIIIVCISVVVVCLVCISNGWMTMCFGFFLFLLFVSPFSLCPSSSVVAKNSALLLNEKEISSSPFSNEEISSLFGFLWGQRVLHPLQIRYISHEHHHVCTHYPICWRPSRLQDECAEEIGQQSRFGEF